MSKLKSRNNCMECIVYHIDNKRGIHELNKNDNGIILLMNALNSIGIDKCSYFGLIFEDKKTSKNIWILNDKSIKKQLKGSQPIFVVAFKFYEYFPFKLEDELIRYYLYHQIRKDLINGKLKPTREILVKLASLTLQVELGNNSYIDIDLIKKYKFTDNPNIDEYFYEDVLNSQETNVGLTINQAELNYLAIASKIPFFGDHYFTAENLKNKTLIEFSIGQAGISFYSDKILKFTIKWNLISELQNDSKTIYLILLDKFSILESNNSHIMDFYNDLKYKDRQIVMLFDSVRLSMSIFQLMVDSHSFYRLPMVNNQQPNNNNKQQNKNVTSIKNTSDNSLKQHKSNIIQRQNSILAYPTIKSLILTEKNRLNNEIQLNNNCNDASLKFNTYQSVVDNKLYFVDAQQRNSTKEFDGTFFDSISSSSSCTTATTTGRVVYKFFEPKHHDFDLKEEPFHEHKLEPTNYSCFNGNSVNNDHIRSLFDDVFDEVENYLLAKNSSI